MLVLSGSLLLFMPQVVQTLGSSVLLSSMDYSFLEKQKKL